MKLNVEGMTCGHCVRAITQAITHIAPAARVTVDLPAKTVIIDGVVEPEAAVAAITEEGYTVTGIEGAGRAPAAQAGGCCGCGQR